MLPVLGWYLMINLVLAEIRGKDNSNNQDFFHINRSNRKQHGSYIRKNKFRIFFNFIKEKHKRGNKKEHHQPIFKSSKNTIF